MATIADLRALVSATKVEESAAMTRELLAAGLDPLEILEEARVGVDPGIDFGKNAEGYLRLSYANSLENIKEGLDRLEAFIKNRQA